MADAPADEKRKRRPLLRPWLRAIHRDAGYVAVGLTLIYALSGLAVNHVADWTDGDPSFKSYSRTHQLGPLAGDPDAVARTVTERLGIKGPPREVFARGEGEIEISFDKRSLHVDTRTGAVVDEGQEPRLFLRFANWLHLNRGKKAWTYIADAYAAALLFLATSGMFMIPGRKGLLGRGAILVGIGIAIPIAYLHFAAP